MRSLWTRIGLGAAGVFVVGMLLVTVVREAKSAASSALSSAVLATVQQAHASASPDMPFRLEGEALGTIKRLVIQRQMQGSLPDVDLDVDLADAASLDRLEDCDLVPVDRGSLSLDQGFTCEATATGGLVTLGEATFHPGDLSNRHYFTRPIPQA